MARARAAVVGRKDEREVGDRAHCPLVGQDVAERAEGPDDVADGDGDAGEEEGHEPDVHELHQPEQRVVEERAAVAEHLEREELEAIEPEHRPEAVAGKVGDGVDGGHQHEEGEEELHRHEDAELNEQVRAGRVHAVAHLLLHGDALDLAHERRDQREGARDGDDELREEDARQRLVLLEVARREVEDGEDHVDDHVDRRPAQVDHRVSDHHGRVL
mmetsp:Transcript_27075/g.71713  ORF Transcript_27075/g.71713 Transcript_27075/m.71713 type:complete len:216 (+) Transcript_27075:1396-2043(+)